MKRIIYLFLLITVFFMVGANSFAYDAQIGGIYYNFSDSEATVTYQNKYFTGNKNAYIGDVVIPSSVDYYGINYKVTSIDKAAFQNCTSLTSVSIPESVTSIGASAFHGASLTSISISESVTSIGMNAFDGCSKLVNVNLPKNLTSIENSTFYGCSSLESVSIPESVTSIGMAVFWECSSLSSIIIPEGVTSIGPCAFYGCSNLKSVSIPKSLTYIGKNAFVDCKGLESVYITDLVSWCAINFEIEGANAPKMSVNPLYYAQHLYLDGSEVKDLVIPQSVKIVPALAFQHFKGLSSVTFANGIARIESDAFYGCSNLSSVIIPQSVAYIGSFAFYNCINISSVVSLNSTPCYLGQDAFSYNSTEYDEHTIHNKTLYVPNGSEASYETKKEWKRFSKIEPVETKFKLTYLIDGEEYKVCEVEALETITPEPQPEKEGYAFSGWSEMPEIMPMENVVITGSFTANSYKLTYEVDGEEYKATTVVYGTELIPEPNPTKEGYTFGGWSEIPSTMPAKDVVVTGTFTVNSYSLTYTVDGEEYKTTTLAFGTELTPEPNPTKEGYTFSGWSEIPATMPAKDVVVTGTFTINSYSLTYTVDGEEYKTVTIVYGTELTPEPNPTKEGYTFSGWSEIPAKMPAHDITINGTFTVNQYEVNYEISGFVYETQSFNYGATITYPDVPNIEGYTFAWEEAPETMPAKDLTIKGSYEPNKYNVVFIINGNIYSITKVPFGSSITPPDAPELEGYSFVWGDYPALMPAKDVTVSGTYIVNNYIVTFKYGDAVLTTSEVEYGAEIPLPESLDSDRYTLVEWLDVPATMPAHNITILASFTDGVRAIKDGQVVDDYYLLNGVKQDRMHRGLNIIRSSDGSTRKVLVK